MLYEIPSTGPTLRLVAYTAGWVYEQTKRINHSRYKCYHRAGTVKAQPRIYRVYF